MEAMTIVHEGKTYHAFSQKYLDDLMQRQDKQRRAIYVLGFSAIGTSLIAFSFMFWYFHRHDIWANSLRILGGC